VIISRCFAAILIAPTLTGCFVDIDPGPLRTESKSIDLGSAEMVRLEVHMSAGQLKMSGGAPKLLQADFRYSESMGKPEVRYDATGFRGRLNVESPSHHRGSIGNVTNDWELRLNDDVPLDVVVHLGAGENRLDLSSLNLRSVEVHMGAGQLNMDLTGDYRKDFTVSVHGGVGEANIRLPKHVGVTAEARGGIGSISTSGLTKRDGRYVNKAYGESKTTIRMDVHGGIGQINLREAS
jgi:N-terminal domain of toast_rack, DUF2154